MESISPVAGTLVVMSVFAASTVLFVWAARRRGYFVRSTADPVRRRGRSKAVAAILIGLAAVGVGVGPLHPEPRSLVAWILVGLLMFIPLLVLIPLDRWTRRLPPETRALMDAGEFPKKGDPRRTLVIAISIGVVTLMCTTLYLGLNFVGI